MAAQRVSPQVGIARVPAKGRAGALIPPRARADRRVPYGLRVITSGWRMGMADVVFAQAPRGLAETASGPIDRTWYQAVFEG